MLRHRVLKGKLTRGHHLFYLDIYQDGKRDDEPLNVIAKRRLEINRVIVVGFRGAIAFCVLLRADHRYGNQC